MRRFLYETFYQKKTSLYPDRRAGDPDHGIVILYCAGPLPPVRHRSVRCLGKCPCKSADRLCAAGGA